jgi:hypothetical protein|nr:MAG TPA: hypothetical protein [Caudoviricetes sp.]
MIINIKGKNFRGYNETDNNLELIFTDFKYGKVSVREYNKELKKRYPNAKIITNDDVNFAFSIPDEKIERLLSFLVELDCSDEE